jgi:RNA polymerase sigma-70 factor, ECF subfamily
MRHATRFQNCEGRVGFRSSAPLEESTSSTRMTQLAIARAQQGDRDALRFLYVRYSSPVYRYVCGIVRDEHEAEDVTQLVFTKLITALAKYDERGVPFFAWLRRLARNLAIDYMRTLKSSPADELVVDGRCDEGASELTHTLSAALAALPYEQRRVVLLRHLVGLSPGEIARCMGRSESAIHSLHHRGRLALRRELIRQESAPLTSSSAAEPTLKLAA